MGDKAVHWRSLNAIKFSFGSIRVNRVRILWLNMHNSQLDVLNHRLEARSTLKTFLIEVNDVARLLSIAIQGRFTVLPTLERCHMLAA